MDEYWYVHDLIATETYKCNDKKAINALMNEMERKKKVNLKIHLIFNHIDYETDMVYNTYTKHRNKLLEFKILVVNRIVACPLIISQQHLKIDWAFLRMLFVR